MRKRNLILLAVPVAAFALLFLAGEKPVLHAATVKVSTCVTTTAAKIVLPQSSTQEVTFGKLKPYDPKNAWFTVSFPENWTVSDKSTPEEAVLVVADPTQNGIVVLRAYAAKDFTQTELGNVLKTFIHDKMSEFDGFTMGNPTSRMDGTCNLVFRYTQTQEGKDYRMYGEGIIQQNYGYVGIIVFLLPQEQYSTKSKSVYEITDSFHVTGKTKD
jgi:hypothetical protein